MKKEEPYYEVHCDMCGAYLKLDGIFAWQTQEEAEKAIKYSDWVETEDGNVFCPKCKDYGIDYDTEEQ